MTDLLPRDRITAALAAANKNGKVALVPFVTAGYPEKDAFIDTLHALATASEVIEVGVPFSDPMADGPTIQRASERALANGVSLRQVLLLVAEFRESQMSTGMAVRVQGNCDRKHAVSSAAGIESVRSPK